MHGRWDGWVPGRWERRQDGGAGQTMKTPYLTTYPARDSIGHQMRNGQENGACGGKAERVQGAVVSRGSRERHAGLDYRTHSSLLMNMNMGEA